MLKNTYGYMMKKLFLLAIFTLALAGCSSDDPVMDGVGIADDMPPTSNTDHSVAFSDILTLAKAQNTSSRGVSSAAATDVVCITDNGSDTLLYAFDNACSGWTIYSSDTRVPPIVAHGGVGTISDALQNEALSAWIQTLAEDMKAIRNAEDSMLNFSAEEIETNKEFWQSITNPTNVVAHFENPSLPDAAGPVLVPEGHYELVSTTYYGEVYDSIPRMTSTDWHQDSPYNNCCPYKSNLSERAPAGCVPIAAAQMLYFLHYSIGVPTEAPSEGYCNSSVNDSSYDWNQYNYTSTIWDTMGLLGLYSGPFIADIGRRLNVHYTDSSSSASVSELPNKVFLPYGISCTYATYDGDIVKSSLSAGMPVLLSARDTNTNNRHAFLTDRYIQKRIVTKLVYQWVYDTRDEDPFTPIGVMPYVPDKIVYSYSSPQIIMIGMNWGWGESQNDSSEWFSLTDEWVKGNYSYNNPRRMVHGFQATNL